jgi:hypothetical protein
MSDGHAAGSRSLVVASVLAGVSLVAVSAAFVAVVANRHSVPANGAFGAVSCSAPHPPGNTLDVTVTDVGGSMMGQAR